MICISYADDFSLDHRRMHGRLGKNPGFLNSYKMNFAASKINPKDLQT